MKDTTTTTGQDRDRLTQAEALRKRGNLDPAAASRTAYATATA